MCGAPVLLSTAIKKDLPLFPVKVRTAAESVISSFISLPFKSCWIIYVDGMVISQAELFRIEDSTP
mgnify:CR=1 FL=1